MDKNDIAALMEEDHPHLRKRRGSSTPEDESLLKQTATRHNSVVTRPVHGINVLSTRHSSLVTIPRHNSIGFRQNIDTASVASKDSSVASAVEKEDGDEGKAARRVNLAQLQDKVLNCSSVKMMELRRVSQVVKIDPKLRLVPFDRCALSDFQMLLSTFKEFMGEDSMVHQVYTSLNDMLHVIIKTMLEENDTLNNSKLARIVSVQSMQLFVSGIYDIAATKCMPESFSNLLMDLCGRISALDAFVRNYFVNEVHELEQIVSSLEDSLKQANQKVQTIQGDISSKDQLHKQKLADMQLMSVIHQARSKAQAKPTALATAASDTKQEEAHNQLVKQHQELLEAHSKLKHDFEALQSHHDSTQLDLDKAHRKITTLLQTVEELSLPMAMDKELQRVRNDLFCERMRVQALENEVQQLRGKQIDASRNKIHHNSLVARIRCQTGVFPLTTAEEIADSSAGAMEEDSDDEEDENSFNTITVKDPAVRLRSMINYSLPLPPKPPVQLSQLLPLGAVTTVLQAVSKLKHQAHIENNLAIATPPASAPIDLVTARKHILAIFHRKQNLDECSVIVNEPRQALVEVVVGYFFAKNTSPTIAQSVSNVILDNGLTMK
ncbi:hypothetical protein THRCLA_20989 [Thraustotheca clavata]|uniref:Uncharacterized protein n=1 Tax=Thraustotheca clavata TaxID=74557 RepID=A0A1W0A200_9STRA|nr:hypothetical protein THRCLA_20989 [Thraustotheca clavata]